jgi:hypothetical protein
MKNKAKSKAAAVVAVAAATVAVPVLSKLEWLGLNIVAVQTAGTSLDVALLAAKTTKPAGMSKVQFKDTAATWYLQHGNVTLKNGNKGGDPAQRKAVSRIRAKLWPGEKSKKARISLPDTPRGGFTSESAEAYFEDVASRIQKKLGLEFPDGMNLWKVLMSLPA